MRRKKAVKAKKSVKRPQHRTLVAEKGELFLDGMPAKLIVRRAKKVAAAMDRVPADAPLTEAERKTIRRELSVVTDGAVGGIQVAYKRRAAKDKFKSKDRRAAKQRAFKTLKRIAGELAKKVVTKTAERAGDAAWFAFVDLLLRYFGS